jgi:hypothetical protein
MMRALRRRSLQLIASVVLAGAVLTVASALSAFASSPLRISNCNSSSARPKLLTLTCGDGNVVLKGLKWSSFGGSTARARGTFVTNTCKPNCAQGKDVSYPVSVKATNPKTCRGGVRVYNRVALQFTARTPLSVSRYKNWTLGCPSSSLG